jgi:hypothetical protein
MTITDKITANVKSDLKINKYTYTLYKRQNDKRYIH